MIIYILAVIGFLICFMQIEIYFWQKSRENFRELKQAYIELQEAKKDLYNLLKDKELEK